MPIDVYELLKRQAEWQRGLARLTWSEKLLLVERLREDIEWLSKSRGPARKPAVR